MSLVLTPDLGDTEDAIVAALEADAVISAAVKDIQSFAGTVEAALQEATRRAPCILLLFGGGEIEPAGMHRFHMDGQWHILVVTRSFRSEKARRHTVGGAIGAYDLVAAVLSALTNNTVGLTFATPDGLQPVSVDLLQAARLGSVERSLVAYELVFSVAHGIAEPDPDQDLTSIHSTYETTNGDGDWSDVAEGLMEP